MRILKSLGDIQVFLDIEIQNVWPSGEKIYDCFGLCNVMTAFDSRSKGYFMRISTVVSVLKGG